MRRGNFRKVRTFATLPLRLCFCLFNNTFIYFSFFFTVLSRRMDDKEGKEKASTNRGTDFHTRGELGKAIERHEKDLKIAIEMGDRAAEGEAYGNLGCTYDSLGDLPKAIEYLSLIHI